MACLTCLCSRRFVLMLALVLVLAGCRSGGEVALSTASFPSGRGFVRHEFTLDQQQHKLWIFVPRNYNPARKSPAILFLHGLFEAGTNADAALSAGLGPVIANRPNDWPFITIFPQSRGTWKGEARQRLALAALEHAKHKYTIDDDRVILAGLSYGGLGTWQIGARYPEKFAALVPVSGHRSTELVERVALMPVWAFAMSGDVIVSAESSEDMCEEIAAKGGKPKLTKFVGPGHDCWDRAVAESNLIDWMLAQRRQPAVFASVAEDAGR